MENVWGAGEIRGGDGVAGPDGEEGGNGGDDAGGHAAVPIRADEGSPAAPPSISKVSILVNI